MPIQLSHISADKKTFDFQYEGQSMPIEYKPSVLTGRFVDRMLQGGSTKDVAQLITELVSDWDIRGPQNRKLEITVDTLLDLPINLMQKILRKCAEDAGILLPMDDGDVEGKVPVPLPNRKTRRSKTTSAVSNGTL